MAGNGANADDAPAFWCDAMLGALARWLRAAGYDAAWEEGIDDADLLRRALADDRILLTCDTELARHGAIRSGRVPALLLPHGLDKVEQLRFVFERLGLERRSARCMACGGRLERVPKASARPEVPARTFRWCDEYFRCRRCAKVFWRGTHWRKIEAALDTL
ncbi:MAG: Mut7-C RNAse domain-containing protein [Phycisphaerae bacterium]